MTAVRRPGLPTEFAGMERFAARKAIVAKLDAGATYIEVVGFDENREWARINVEEQSGWVAARFLTRRADQPRRRGGRPQRFHRHVGPASVQQAGQVVVLGEEVQHLGGEVAGRVVQGEQGGQSADDVDHHRQHEGHRATPSPPARCRRSPGGWGGTGPVRAASG